MVSVLSTGLSGYRKNNDNFSEVESKSRNQQGGKIPGTLKVFLNQSKEQELTHINFLFSTYVKSK